MCHVNLILYQQHIVGALFGICYIFFFKSLLFSCEIIHARILELHKGPNHNISYYKYYSRILPWQRERERESEGIEHASGIYFIIKSKSEYKVMVFTKVVQDGYACRVTISHLPTMDKALLKAVGMSMSSSSPPRATLILLLVTVPVVPGLTDELFDSSGLLQCWISSASLNGLDFFFY